MKNRSLGYYTALASILQEATEKNLRRQTFSSGERPGPGGGFFRPAGPVWRWPENPRGYPMATQVKALGHKGLRAPMPSKNRPLATGMATKRDLLLRLSADMPYVSLSMLQNLRGDNTLLRFHFSGVKTDENGIFGEIVELYRKIQKGGNPP